MHEKLVPVSKSSLILPQMDNHQYDDGEDQKNQIDF